MARWSMWWTSTAQAEGSLSQCGWASQRGVTLSPPLRSRGHPQPQGWFRHPGCCHTEDEANRDVASAPSDRCTQEFGLQALPRQAPQDGKHRGPCACFCGRSYARGWAALVGVTRGGDEVMGHSLRQREGAAGLPFPPFTRVCLPFQPPEHRSRPLCFMSYSVCVFCQHSSRCTRTQTHTNAGHLPEQQRSLRFTAEDRGTEVQGHSHRPWTRAHWPRGLCFSYHTLQLLSTRRTADCL